MANNLCNQLLIATPALDGTEFHQTVIYIFDHSEEGAMGIAINRPTNHPLHEIMGQLKINNRHLDAANHTVIAGGPVRETAGFVMHPPCKQQFEATFHATNKLHITSSPDVLQAIADGDGPKQSLIALGYAGWSAGQLEQELKENAWLSCPANSQILFSTPFPWRWKEAIDLLGLDLNFLSQYHTGTVH